MDHERETLTWETFGDAAQELARAIADDGFRPDVILAIAAADSSSPARSATPCR